MTLRALVVSGLLIAATAVPMLADDAKAPLHVSVQVVRSCRVTSDQAQVSVDCGKGAQPAQVSSGGAPLAERTLAGQTPVSPATVSTVTIHF